MTNETIARNYAGALFDLAQRHEGLEAFAQGMATVVALLDEHFGRTHVTVTVARALDQEALQQLSGKLSRILGKEAIPHVRVKPAILGGILLKAGDTVFDGTLRRRIKQLRRQLVSAELPESVFGASDS